jgi:hypothetical protein
MIKNTLNLVMILCILAVMDYRFITNVMHEVLGVVTLLLFIIHNTLNHQWYTAIGKGRTNVLRMLSTITNLLLLVLMLAVTVTGVLISQTVFSSFSLSGNLLAHQLHMFFAYLGFILSAIHLGFHWNALCGKLCRWLRIDCTKSSYIFLSRIASLLTVGYGIYASFTRHIGSKLLLQHDFNDWTAAPSLVDFLFDYMAIMGCYVAITHYLSQLLQYP